ncbi:MAG: carboxypeptidase-like regulatory domain-containing protein [Bacteroidales bacterium]|nr:carboxypeptidase-like regulatory domain-containing protein [Bacteroidales bacterium]
MIIGISTFIILQVDSHVTNDEFADNKINNDTIEKSVDTTTQKATIEEQIKKHTTQETKNLKTGQNTEYTLSKENKLAAETTVNLDSIKKAVINIDTFKTILPTNENFQFVKIDKSKNKTDIIVTGQIFDGTNKEPLIGANVVEKGTTNGTTTDFDGEFSLQVRNDSAKLVISYIGYSPQIVAIDNDKSISVTLSEDYRELDAVVKIGYGIVKKEDVTSSISSLSDKNIDSRPVLGIDQALQGKAAGVQVKSNKSKKDTLELAKRINEMAEVKNNICHVTISYVTQYSKHTEPVNGKEKLASFIAQNKKIKMKDPINIEICMTIEDGSFSNISCLEKQNENYYNETLRLIKEYGNWNPAIHEGKKIKEEVIIIITFEK